MSPSLVVLLALAQQTPPTRPRIDPALPDALRPAVERAIAAELDPKRGTGNAVEILKAEKKKYSDPQRQLSLDLRVAAIVLRQHFLRAEKFPEPIRYEQALSTYSRLDLSDPGVKEWVERTLAHHPYARKRIGKKKQRAIEAAVLTRGGLDRKLVARVFQKVIEATGFELAIVPAKKATMIIKASAESAPSKGKLRTVRVRLGLESIRDGKVVWSHDMFREASAPEAAAAIDAALQWHAKIGGRELFFRWLGETAFHSMLESGPQATQHAAGHDDH